MNDDRDRDVFPRRPEEEIDAEVDFHIEARTRELISRGVDPAEARRRALERFGEVAPRREAMLKSTIRRRNRSARALLLHDLRQDVAYAFRVLRRSPLFTATAVLMLALGLGANTAVFSVARGVLFESLPAQAPAELYIIETEVEGSRRGRVSGPDFMSLNEEQRVFDGIVAFNAGEAAVVVDGEPFTTGGAQISKRFFEVLGGGLVKGRFFMDNEFAENGTRVALVSHAFWQERLSARGDVLGRTIRAWGQEHTIVGVLAPDTGFPPDTDVFVPVLYGELFDATTSRFRRGERITALGRARDTIGEAALQGDLRRVGTLLQARFPETNTGVTFVGRPLSDALVGDVRTPLLLMLGAVGLLLLVACANVANLLMVRATARRSEFAVRAALGASRSRLVRQLLAESALLTGAGALLGVGLAWLATRVLIRFRPIELIGLEAVALDPAVAWFVLALTVLTALLFGVTPALHGSVRRIASSLREGGRGGSGGVRSARARSALVVLEMAIAAVLLIGAGLLVRSLVNLHRIDAGFRPEGAITFRTIASGPAWSGTPERLEAFYERLSNELQTLPGVQSIGMATALPLTFDLPLFVTRIDGRAPDHPAEFRVRMVTPSFIEAAGGRLLRGRMLEGRDRMGAPDVVLINRAGAERWFPGGDAVGQRLLAVPGETSRPGTPVRATEWEIVGVVEDMVQGSPGRPAEPELLFPWAQQARSAMSTVIRADDVVSLAPRVREILRGIDPNMPVRIIPLESVFSESIARPRFFTALLAAFATMTLTLATIGIFGVMAFAVAQRRREIGVRIAVGADPRLVAWMVARNGLALAALGVAIGCATVLALGRILESQLFGVERTDPVTLGAVSVILLATAAISAYAPARAAARTDPAVVLREG